MSDPNSPITGVSIPSAAQTQEMTIIPFENYLKDPLLQGDLRDLMSGNMFVAACAQTRMRGRGYPDSLLNNLRDTGFKWKQMGPPRPIEIKMEPAEEDIEKLVLNVHDKELAAEIGRQTGYVAMRSIGLTVVGSGASAVVQVKDIDVLKHSLRHAQMVKHINGKRIIWRTRMNNGVPVIDPNTVKIASLSKEIRVLRIVKGFGGGLALVGAGISISDFCANPDEKRVGKLGVDLIMTGVSFVPPYGWVVAGIYFVADAALDYCGIDWWAYFYDNVVVDTRPMALERLDALMMAMH